MQINKVYLIFGVICAVIFGLSNSGLHPLSGSTGYTGSPVDSNCGQCHTGNNTNLDGEITIDGLPSTIETGETYTLTVTVTNPNGNAVKAGFQLVALTGTNGNAGTMANPSASTQIRVGGGRNYFGHAPAPNFPASNEITFAVDWTAPATTGSNPQIKFYAATVIANGANGNGNDRVRLTNLILPIINAVGPLEASISNITSTLCADSANGSATASATGGTPPYNYAWNNGVNGATNTSLPAGLAVVTVTDNVGATATASTTISAPPPVNAVASGSVICSGASNGTASVLASGGVGGFSFTWSTGQNGSSISGLGVGTYTVTVTDNNGCQESSSTEVTESPAIFITATINNVNCFGLSDGSISTSVSGGTPAYFYNWSNGSNQPNISNLSANSYTVTVTDAASCTSSETFVVQQPFALVANVTNINNVTCFNGSNGSAQITSTGGTPPYSYQWSNGASGTGNTNTQINLIAGIYHVTVTDFFDCNTVQTVQIMQPAEIGILGNINNVSCFGENNGSILLVISNGVGNFTYLWSNLYTTNNINNLSPGIYSVTVTDANACSKTAQFSITEPDQLIANTVVSSVSCNNGNNGAIFLQINGGNGGNLYNWSNGDTNQNLSNLYAGTYTVTVTDIEGCSASAIANITEPTPIQLSVLSSTNATCLGAANGSLSIVATNGASPFLYHWSNGSSSAQLNNVTSGDYFVTVTDFNNCYVIDTFTIESNASFSINLLSSTDILCHGDTTGTAYVTDVASYTYLWSTGQTNSTVDKLPAGVHTVMATEAGCQSIPLEVTINQPPLMQANLLAADTILCPPDSNGYLSVVLEGGVGMIHYEWSHRDTFLLTDSLKAGIYTISLTDEHQCLESYKFKIHLSDTINIIDSQIDSVRCFGESNGAIALVISGGFGDLDIQWSNTELEGDTLINLSAGTYYATITDLGNCTLTDSFDVKEPEVLEANVTIIDESMTGAEDGSIIIAPIGGTGPFSIVWSNGDSTLTLENLSPGVFSFVLTDNNGCSFNSWAVVGGGDCGLSATYTTENTTCYNTNDGAIHIQISGAFKAYDTLLYYNNALINSPLNNLLPGTYSIIVSDSSGCIAILSNIVLSSEFAEIIVDNIIVSKPTTLTSNDGAITVQLSGGEGNLTYEWSKDGLVLGNQASLVNINAGVYMLKVTDAAGCILTREVNLESTSSLQETLENAISFYPSPVKNNFTVQSTYIITKLELFDIYGNLIFTDNPKQKVVDVFTDNIIKDNSGFIVCRIWVNDQSITKKIVILK